MRPPPFRLQAVLRAGPEACVTRVREAVGEAKGFVLGVAPHANQALTFELEVPAGSLPALVAALQRQGFSVPAPKDPASAAGTLFVQLVHHEGDKKMTVPAVPG